MRFSGSLTETVTVQLCYRDIYFNIIICGDFYCTRGQLIRSERKYG
jgi:hypothetical protein